MAATSVKIYRRQTIKCFEIYKCYTTENGDLQFWGSFTKNESKFAFLICPKKLIDQFLKAIINSENRTLRDNINTPKGEEVISISIAKLLNTSNRPILSKIFLTVISFKEPEDFEFGLDLTYSIVNFYQ